MNYLIPKHFLTFRDLFVAFFQESRNDLWGKTKFGFTFAAENYLDKVNN